LPPNPVGAPAATGESMSVQSNPKLALRRLTHALARIRGHTVLSNAALAELAGTNPATLSRLLNGEFSRPPVTVVDRLARIFEELGLLPGEGLTRKDLVGLAQGAQSTGWRPWWHPYKDILSGIRADYFALEQEVVKIQSFSGRGLPELLQTPAYAEAVLRAHYRRAPDETVSKWLELRAHRQRRMLESSDPADLWMLVDESALHRRVVDRTAMAVQLDWLVKLADRPHIKIAVIPYSAGMYKGSGDYSILTFSDPLDRDLVLIQTFQEYEWIEEPARVNKVRDGFERLFALALSARRTVAAIKAARAALTA
jgi:transcriptional regulator with XRE-family HTH domain